MSRTKNRLRFPNVLFRIKDLAILLWTANSDIRGQTPYPTSWKGLVVKNTAKTLRTDETNDFMGVVFPNIVVLDARTEYIQPQIDSMSNVARIVHC